MVSKGHFVGLDWNRITRLHNQVMTGTKRSLAGTQEPTKSIALSRSRFLCASHHLAVSGRVMWFK